MQKLGGDTKPSTPFPCAFAFSSTSMSFKMPSSTMSSTPLLLYQYSRWILPTIANNCCLETDTVWRCLNTTTRKHICKVAVDSFSSPGFHFCLSTRSLWVWIKQKDADSGVKSERSSWHVFLLFFVYLLQFLSDAQWEAQILGVGILTGDPWTPIPGGPISPGAPCTPGSPLSPWERHKAFSYNRSENVN